MKTFTSTLVFLAVVLFGIAFMPTYEVKSNITLSQIVTVSKTSQPAGTSQNRAWFVEAVQ